MSNGAVPGRDPHAQAGQEEADAGPDVDGEEGVESGDQVADDDGADERGDGGAGVHHSGPLSQLRPAGGCVSENPSH